MKAGGKGRQRAGLHLQGAFAASARIERRVRRRGSILSRRIGQRRLWQFPRSLAPSQQNEQSEERHQRENKEDRAAAMVQGRVDQIRVHMNAEHAQGENPEAISRDAQRNDGKRERGFLPGRPEQ